MLSPKRFSVAIAKLTEAEAQLGITRSDQFPSVYATALDDEKYLNNTRMYLAISAGTSEEELIRKAPLLLKVCSATHIDHLVKQALPGIQLTHLTNPPNAIPVKLKYQYFSVNQSGPAWEAVRRARNFAAFVPGEFPNPEMELLILLPNPA